MKVVYEPRVHLVARQTVNRHGLDEFLESNGWHWHSDAVFAAEELCETAGRLCYQSYNHPRPGGNKSYLKNILESSHGSILEHAVWSFIIEHISRNCSLELIRHRNLSPSQVSQR